GWERFGEFIAGLALSLESQAGGARGRESDLGLDLFGDRVFDLPTEVVFDPHDPAEIPGRAADVGRRHRDRVAADVVGLRYDVGNQVFEARHQVAGDVRIVGLYELDQQPLADAGDGAGEAIEADAALGFSAGERRDNAVEVERRVGLHFVLQHRLEGLGG